MRRVREHRGRLPARLTDLPSPSAFAPPYHKMASGVEFVRRVVERSNVVQKLRLQMPNHVLQRIEPLTELGVRQESAHLEQRLLAVCKGGPWDLLHELTVAVV